MGTFNEALGLSGAAHRVLDYSSFRGFVTHMHRYRFVILAAIVAAAGCASTPPPAPPEVPTESAVLPYEFDSVWQATRDTLKGQNYEIYTRDKRGMFVAHTPRKGTFSIPNRARITVILERVTAGSTRVTVEAVRERYRMPLFRNPGWKEQPEVDLTDRRQAVLEGIAATMEAQAPPA